MSVGPSQFKFSHLYKKRSSHRHNDEEMSTNRSRAFPFFGQMTSRLHKQFFNRGLMSCLSHQEARVDHKAPSMPTFHPLPPHPPCINRLLEQPRADLETQTRYAWNPEDRSLNIFIKDDNIFSIHRHPVAQSTDGIRGRIGFSTGVHLWEVTWPTRQRGTHAVVGIATKEAPLHCPGYKPLVGNNSDSWGWDIGRNKLIHQGADQNCSNHALPTVDSNHNFSIPDTFGLVLDMQQGSLGFVINGRYLGVAFDGLKGKTLFPAVSAVWGHCEISMRYVCSLPSQPLSLLELSKREIEGRVRGSAYEQILQLPLPTMLKQFVVENSPHEDQSTIQSLLHNNNNNNHHHNNNNNRQQQHETVEQIQKLPQQPTQQQQQQQQHKQVHKSQQRQQQRHTNEQNLYISMPPQQQHLQNYIQHHIQRVQQQHKYHHHISLKPHHL